MGWYTVEIECVYCGKLFESSRRDAKFCSGACRTAQSRLNKRREKAYQGIINTWEKDLVDKYLRLTGDTAFKDIDNQIKDMFLINPDLAAQSVNMMCHVRDVIEERFERMLKDKDRQIERVKVKADKYDEIVGYIRSL